jgi:photosystem II stability/assembly factor-like uncharacterized protein
MKRKRCAAKILLILVAAFCGASLFAQTYVWTPTSAPNDAAWTGIASSADGTKLAACCNYPVVGVYTSSNAGFTWGQVPTPTTQNPWNAEALNCIASSADGIELVVGSWTGYENTNSGYIYYSNSSGSLWWQTYIPGELFWENWTSIAESFSGATMIAAGHYTIFVSTDMGASWVSRANAPNPRGYWKTVACSAVGTKLLATDVIQLYTSTNTGNTWSLTCAPSNQWNAIASSSDGTKLVACNDYSIGRIYTSTNSGLTWTLTSAPSNTFWSAVTSSTNGAILAAASYSGNIYFSTNSGLTWTSNSFPTSISAMASTADGTKLFAAFSGGAISIGQLVEPAQNFSASASSSGVNLQFIGTPNCPYVLLAADNLNRPITWKPLVTNSTDGNGNWSFTDTNVSQNVQRYYTTSY